MSADLHGWNLHKFVQKKSIQEKFLTWVDKQNKIEIDKQISTYYSLLPHLKEGSKFELDRSKLYVLKGG